MSAAIGAARAVVDQCRPRAGAPRFGGSIGVVVGAGGGSVGAVPSAGSGAGGAAGAGAGAQSAKPQAAQQKPRGCVRPQLWQVAFVVFVTS